MLDLLKSFTDALLVIFQLLISIVSSILQFFMMIPRFIAYLEAVFAYVPSPLLVFLLAGVSISVILLIVGRN